MDELDDSLYSESPDDPAGERPSYGHAIAVILLAVLGIVRITMNFAMKSVREEQEERERLEAEWRSRPRETGMDFVERDFRRAADAGEDLSRSAAEWFKRPIDAFVHGAADSDRLPAPQESTAQPDD